MEKETVKEAAREQEQETKKAYEPELGIDQITSFFTGIGAWKRTWPAGLRSMVPWNVAAWKLSEAMLARFVAQNTVTAEDMVHIESRDIDTEKFPFGTGGIVMVTTEHEFKKVGEVYGELKLPPRSALSNTVKLANTVIDPMQHLFRGLRSELGMPEWQPIERNGTTTWNPDDKAASIKAFLDAYGKWWFSFPKDFTPEGLGEVMLVCNLCKANMAVIEEVVGTLPWWMGRKVRGYVRELNEKRKAKCPVTNDRSIASVADKIMGFLL